jgi:cysteine desulfurase
MISHTSIRFSFGRFTTEEEVEYASELILSRIKKLRDLSPLWEIAQEGIDINKINWSKH